MPTPRPRWYDPHNVESLIMGYPVPRASAADKIRASQLLRDKGLGKDEIAARLRCSPRNVTRMITRHVNPEPRTP